MIVSRVFVMFYMVLVMGLCACTGGQAGAGSSVSDKESSVHSISSIDTSSTVTSDTSSVVDISSGISSSQRHSSIFPSSSLGSLGGSSSAFNGVNSSPASSVSSNSSSSSVSSNSSRHDYSMGITIFDIHIRLDEATVEEVVDSEGFGLSIAGDIYVSSSKGEIPLYMVSARVTAVDDSYTEFTNIYGTSNLPFPKLGFLEAAQFDELVNISFSLHSGNELALMSPSLRGDRHYLVYEIDGGFRAVVDGLTFEAIVQPSARFILDPVDPYFYFYGNLPGLKGMTIKDVGVGVSLSQEIPFRPQVNWGLEESLVPFEKGLVLLEGTIPLGAGIMSVDGEFVVAGISGETALPIEFDAPEEGLEYVEYPEPWRTITESVLPQFALVVADAFVPRHVNLELKEAVIAGNGSFNFDLAFLGLTILGKEASPFTVTGASFIQTFLADKKQAIFSGYVNGEDLFSGMDVPISLPKASFNMAGVVNVEPEFNFMLRSEVSAGINGDVLSQWLGVDVGNIAGQDMTLFISETGTYLQGELSAGGLHSALNFHAGGTLQAYFSGSPEAWMANIHGDFILAGVDLVEGVIHLGFDGFKVRGAFDTGLSQIAMSGEISPAGIDVRGVADVLIPFENVITSFIVSGARCGYTTVTDGVKCGTDFVANQAVCGTENIVSGAICGYSTVTSALECGSSTVTSAALCGADFVANKSVCGLKTVTNAAACGTSTVTDGAICGFNTITNASVCGVDTLLNAFQCALNGFKNCEKAKSCQVAATCETPKSCQVAAECDVPRSCSQPNTCDVENTCSQPKKCHVPKTCDIEASCEVEDVALGEYRGAADFRLSGGGLSANLQGEYCINGACHSLAGGRLDLSAAPKVCITIPGGVGEVCAAL